MPRSRLFIALSLIAAYGCRCGPPSTGGLVPDFDPDPKALSFEACPIQDETGKAVEGVFPDEKTVKLKNLGKALGTVSLSFSGTDQAAFKVPPGKSPESVGANSEVEFPIHFSPLKRGDSTATLTIEDGSEETDPVSVSLVGTGRNLPSQPTIEVETQNKDILTQYDVCFAGGSCLLNYPDNVFYGESSTLKIRVKNTGCPALRISSIELGPINGSASSAFSLLEPGNPPTVAAPLLLTTADDNAQTSLAVQFAPATDGSGITQRYAMLKMKTNDPAYPEYDITLFGNAAEPSVYAEPTFCDFNQSSDLCGNVTKVANKASFKVKNGGNTAIVINSVAFGRPSQTRFTITQNVQGQTIAPGGQLNLEVTHTDAPLYVTELLTVSAEAGGKSAGTAILSLAGGTKPCLTTDPTDQLDFQNADAGVTTRQVTIKNGAGCGELIVNRAFTDPSPYFSISTTQPTIPAKTSVPAGGSLFAYVDYKKPLSGGVQTGILRIDTNDPDVGPPPYAVVRLYSESPLDQLPVAQLKGCLGSDPTCLNKFSSSMNVKLSTLSPKELWMWGRDSYDPPGTTTKVAQFQFQLFPPTNAQAASLENNGAKVTKDTAKLTLDPSVTGVYRVVLTVWDSAGQASPASSELKIFVTQ